MYQQIKFTILDKIVKSEHSIILFKLIFKYTHKKHILKIGLFLLYQRII